MLVFVVDHFYEKCALKLKNPPFYISVYQLDFFENILVTNFVCKNIDDSILIYSQFHILYFSLSF